MIYFFDPAGRITRRVQAPFDEAAVLAEEGEQWVQSDIVADDSTHFIFCGAIVPFPARPSSAHLWDWGEYQWTVTAEAIADVKAERCNQVNRFRDERHVQPIEYQGIPFDADGQSVDNMRGLTARIERGDGLTAGWIGWRTFDNTMVWAEGSTHEVLAHLYAIARALEDRKQALLLAAWAHKAAIRQLDDLDAILKYDISVGWPD